MELDQNVGILRISMGYLFIFIFLMVKNRLAKKVISVCNLGIQPSHLILNNKRLPSGAHKFLFEAIQELEAETCLKFVKRSNERDYIDFFVGSGCYSEVGRKGGKQEISLGNSCWYSHTVVHEVS